jgi:polysaccharide export outer membrane protein
MTILHPAKLTRLILAIAVLVVAARPALAQFQGPPVTQPVPPQLTGPSVGANPPAITPHEDTPESAAIVANPGDTLEITVIGVTALNPLHPQVDAQGNIGLPYIGTVHVAGLTITQMQQLISQRYREGEYILNAQISIQIVTSPTQVITVTGEVKSPNVVPALGARKLLDVIAACGGFTPLASHLVTVSRRSTNQTIQVLLDPNPMDSTIENIAVYPGDTVIVPRAGQVYVMGSVKDQNFYALSSNTPLTLMQAISMAGGTNFEAALSGARIIRTEGSQRKAIALNLKRIYTGKEADPILQADDIVYIPGNPIKGALKSGAAGILTSAILGIGYYLK